MKSFPFCLFLLLSCVLRAQENTPYYDSVPYLNEVIVSAFGESNSKQKVPASITVLGNRQFQRYGNVSLVPAFNTVAGVRMEERSPGSYRLSIRGSLLRSPFGVRNVKIYWADMPLTDAGGNTYLNLIDPNSIGTAEILKGPAGSVYGAGTGGVVTFKERYPYFEDRGIGGTVQAQAGSYGMWGASAFLTGSHQKFQWNFLQSHLQADGYRKNSTMRRDVTQFNGVWRYSGKMALNMFALYGDLGYRTPGGLTLLQMQQDPRQARPATPTLPSAEAQRAGIYNKTLFAGLSHQWKLSSNIHNTTSILYTNTYFINPFITNYETRVENGLGLRTRFNWDKAWAQQSLGLVFGAEWQQGWSQIDSSGNNAGIPDGNTVRSKVQSGQYFLFAQANYRPAKQWLIQAGLSYNHFSFQLQPSAFQLDYNNPWLPRLAAQFTFAKELNAFVSVSKGYSSPTLAEVKPSAGGFDTNLQAEYGWNYEGGIKGTVLRSRIRFDLAVFQFNLNDAIVRRTNAAGAEFFVNAGSTVQKGIEVQAEWFAMRASNQRWIRNLSIWTSLTYYQFKFTDYKSGSSDFSGNALTGVPGQTVLGGIDLETKHGLYVQGTVNHTSRLPLNDANDQYADAYTLLQGRVGWKLAMKNSRGIDVFLGIDNALNQAYSLGNDINAFGRRYYNPSATRNYYGGVRFSF
jgi:iron complex outermembrane receptor protein